MFYKLLPDLIKIVYLKFFDRDGYKLHQEEQARFQEWRKKKAKIKL
jgi:hypothetical protein